MRTFRCEVFTTKEELMDMQNDLTEKFGEPCVVLPNTIRPSEEKVAYLCDRKACFTCHPETCQHTTDIRHAVNFIGMGDGKFMERRKYEADNHD